MSLLRALALGLPMLLLLGLAELGLRLSGFGADYQGEDRMIVASDDPVLIHEYRPSHRVEHHGVEYRTNAAGFRDREFAPKARDAFRILAVGDSVTFGYREAAQHAFPQQLERRLAGRPGPRIEVFNLGVAGYNALQEVRLFETRGLALDPDLLVLAYVLNDNKQDGADGGLTLHFRRSPSRLYDWIGVRLRRLARRIGRDVTTEAFDELAALARSRELPVVVMIVPELRFRDGEWSRPERHRAVAALARARGFRVLDLKDAFVADGFESLMRDNVHPNPRGYALIARQLERFLEDEGLLPVLAGSSRSPRLRETLRGAGHRLAENPG
jgi:lysophospholipase L1-like esterase